METIKWSELNVGSGVPLIDEGIYLVQIDGFDKTTATTGTEHLLAKGHTLPSDSDESGTSRSVQEYLALTTPAQWRLGQFIDAAGYDHKKLPDMIVGSEEFNRIIFSCKGRKMYWEIIQEANPKTGNMKNKVQRFIPYEDQEPIEYESNVPAFIKNKVKKAGLV